MRNRSLTIIAALLGTLALIACSGEQDAGQAPADEDTAAEQRSATNGGENAEGAGEAYAEEAAGGDEEGAGAGTAERVREEAQKQADKAKDKADELMEKAKMKAEEVTGEDNKEKKDSGGGY